MFFSLFLNEVFQTGHSAGEGIGVSRYELKVFSGSVGAEIQPITLSLDTWLGKLSASSDTSPKSDLDQ